MGVFRTASRRLCGVAAATVVIFGVAVVPFTTGTAGAAGGVSLAQCANGPLTAPVACNNATSSYGNGDLNQNNSHYKEGDFVPYTLQMNGLSSGMNTIQFGYRVGDSGKHAQDYLGSFDHTETTSSTPSAHNANNNNPCDSLTLVTACTPSSPTSTVAVTAPNFAGMDTSCGTSGTFPPANFIPGTIDLFGAPTGSTLSNFTYVDQNQSSASGCVTDVSVQINLSAALTSSQTIVLAWGGHVASQQDWGAGNSASFINGSPYHMFLDKLNGSTIGSQDHQMKTSAIFFTPSVSTTIINNGTSAALSGPINIGTTVHDTATLSNASATAGGTITFTLRNDTGTTACAGTTIGTPQVVTISPAGAANSPGSVSSATFSPTTGGSYSYQAVYSGDTADVPGNFTSACEPFTVQGNTPTLATQAQFSTDNTTFSNVPSTPISIGDYVRDTSTLSGAATPVAGSVTYKLYPGTGCTGNTPNGTAVFTNTQTGATSATLPNSGSFQVTTAQSYQWQATFTSTNNQNTNATSACGTETFTVGPNAPTISTAEQSSTDNTTFNPVTGNIAIGNWVRDTSTLSGAAAPTAGTVTYTLYDGNGCNTSTNTPTGNVEFTSSGVALGSPSGSFQVTTAGTYQWQAVFTSTNGQNTNATSPCGSEVFTVNPNSPTLSTTAQASTDNVTFAPFTGALTIGTFVRDTSTLSGAATPTTGTVQYFLYQGTGCTSGTPNGSVAFSSSAIPLTSGGAPQPSTSFQVTSAGNYQWQAVYTSGNGQNNNATSPCGSEVFTVNPNAPTLSTTAQVSTDNVTFGPVSSAVAINDFVRDTSSLTGTAKPVAGTIVYTLYSGDGCSSNAPTGTIQFQTSALAVSSDTPPNSDSYQVTTAGTYQWQAVFTSTNGQNNNATSPCGSEVFTVGPNNPSLGTTAQVSTDGGTTYGPISGNIAIGNLVRDTSSLSSVATPVAGTIVYTLYSGDTCNSNLPVGAIQFQSAALPVTSTTPPPSGAFQVLDAGTYQWQAVFTSTNGQNSNATSPCGSEVFSVNPNSPTLSTTAQVSTDGGTTYSPITGNVAIGNVVRDTSSLSGAATPVAGSVVYTLYSGNGCDSTTNTPTGTVEFQTGSLPVTSATLPNSGSFTVTTAGTYQWQAVFTTGNGQNNSATSPCGSEVFTVNPNSPMLSTTAQVSTDGGTTYSPIVGNIAIGNLVRDTSSLGSAATPVAGTIVYTLYSGSGCNSNTPTGTVEFQTSALAVSSATPPASGSFQVTTAGAYQWQAVFTSTNGQNISATSACGTEGFTVNPNSPTLSTTAQVSTDGGTTYNPITGNVAIGNVVRDTSSLSGAATPVTGSVIYTLYNGNGCDANTPTGTVAFQTGSLPVTGSTPPASGSFTVTTAGTYQWQAVFTTGNGQNNNATSPCGSEDFTVGPNSPTLSTTAQSSTDNVTFGPITSALAINDFVRDTSSLTGTAAPVAGTIVYTLYSGNGCASNAPTGTVAFQTGSLAVTSATPPDSGSFQVTTAGTYQWQAVFTSGNGQNGNATSPCGSEVFSVGPNSPTLSTTAQVSTDGGTTYNPISGNIAIGNLVRDTSSLLGAATPVAGSVVYTLYSGNGCDSNAPTGTVEFQTGSLAVSSATPPASGSFTVTTAGTYQWQAVFTTGNGQNNSATSPCGSEVFTVNPNAPTLSTTAQSSTDNVSFSDMTGPATIGTFVRDTSSLSGTAAPVAGTIVYTLYSGNGCDSNAPTGTVEFQTSALAVSSDTPPASDSFQVTTAGTYQWQAVFTSTNGQNGNATSPCGSEVFSVNPNSPTLSTTAEVSTDGGTTYSPITGNIAIGDLVQDTSSLSGAATPVAGTIVYTLYSGNGCDSTTGTPTGAIEYQTNALAVTGATPPASGSFTVTTAGTYQWQAVFTSTNGQNNSATSPCGSEVFTVNPNAPTLSTTAQSSTDNVSFSDMTGPVTIGTFVRDTSSLTGTATPIAGTVVYTLYSGNGCDSNAPTGTVVFQTGALAVTNATPPASDSFQVTTAGTYQWQAVFTTGNGQNNSATSPCGSEVFGVNPNAPTLSTTAQVSTDNVTFGPITSPVAINNFVQDTSNLTGTAAPVAGTIVYTLYSGDGCASNTPTGTVEFQTGSLAVTSATPPDSGSFQVATAGTYQWQAVFTSTNGQNESATSPCGSEVFSVGPNSPTLSTTAQVSTDGGTTYNPVSGNIAIGNLVRDTSSLSSAATPVAGTVVYTLYSGDGCDSNAPTGTVEFQTGSLAVTSATPPASGSFTVTTAGTYQWQAVFTSTNGQNNDATSPCGTEVFSVNPNSPTLSTTAQSSTDNVTFSDMTGSVTIGTFVRDTASLSGAATPTTGSVVYTLYTGTGCSENAPTGTVVFSDTETLASNTIPPSASIQLNTAGTYQWQAVYTSGNGQNNNATSPCGSEDVTVTTPNFTIMKTNVPGNTLPVTPGSTIPYTITVQNVGDGPGTATIEDVLPSSLTMSGAPACTVTDPSTDSCTVPSSAVTTLDATVTLASGHTATITFSAVLAATDTADVVNTATIKTGVCTGDQSTEASVNGHAVTLQCSSTVTNPVPNFTVTKTNTPGNGQPVTAGSTIPYKIAIKNVGDGAGSATITDALPSSLTIQGTPSCAVTGTDTCKVTNTSGSTWTFAVALAAGDTATATFNAKVAATATGTVTNTATITTGPCNTTSGCSSTVSNPIPPVTAPVTTPTTTTTTTTAPPVTKPSGIAFTGADIAGMAAGGLALIGLGGLLLLVSRRRRASSGDIA